MKYMLIDVTTVEGTTVVKIAELRNVQLHGKILQAQGRQVIAPPLENRGFSKLEKLQLQYLYWNTCQKPPTEDYAELIKQCTAVFEALPVDATPVAELEREVARLYPDEPKPEGVAATPRAAGEPPKAGSTTGQVWVIAEEVYAKRGNVLDKETRTQIIAACTNAGINAATAATQYSKWKASKSSQ